MKLAFTAYLDGRHKGFSSSPLEKRFFEETGCYTRERGTREYGVDGQIPEVEQYQRMMGSGFIEIEHSWNQAGDEAVSAQFYDDDTKAACTVLGLLGTMGVTHVRFVVERQRSLNVELEDLIKTLEKWRPC